MKAKNVLDGEKDEKIVANEKNKIKRRKIIFSILFHEIFKIILILIISDFIIYENVALLSYFRAETLLPTMPTQ